MTEQTAWMREYKRLRSDLGVHCIIWGALSVVLMHNARNGEEERAEAAAVMARKALDAHVRALVEENELLRGALFRCVDGWAKGDDIAGPMRAARAALAAPKDAP